jgi:hypothetical protein
MYFILLAWIWAYDVNKDNLINTSQNLSSEN